MRRSIPPSSLFSRAISFDHLVLRACWRKNSKTRRCRARALRSSGFTASVLLVLRDQVVPGDDRPLLLEDAVLRPGDHVPALRVGPGLDEAPDVPMAVLHEFPR